jgi:hypothetical protein
VGRLIVAKPGSAKRDKHDKPEAEPEPKPPVRRPWPRPWHHGYRWVLYLFAAAVLALAVYLGWRIVDAFLRWMKVIEDF